MPDINDLGPRGLAWKRVSPDYIKVRLISASISTVIWVLITGVPVLLALLSIWGEPSDLWRWLAPAIVLVWGIIDLCLIPRRVRAIGYAERDTELWLRRGIIFRSVTVVPYGRMQYVDIKTGPLLNAFGLADLTLHTAAAATDANLPGLPRAEADRLREELTRRGEELMVGL